MTMRAEIAAQLESAIAWLNKTPPTRGRRATPTSPVRTGYREIRITVGEQADARAVVTLHAYYVASAVNEPWRPVSIDREGTGLTVESALMRLSVPKTRKRKR